MKDNRLTQRRSCLKAIGSVGALGLAGCIGDVTEGDGTGGDLPSVSVATTETGSLGLLTAIIKEEGIDHDNGINFEIEPADPPSAMQLLRNEAVETGIFSPQGAAIANTEGSEIRLFGPALMNHISLMTSPENEDISGWEDLVGETVGVMDAPSSMWNHTKLLLGEKGLDMEEDFDLRTGSPGSIHSFNQRGDVQAHAHFIPVTITARQSGEMQEVAFYPDEFEELYGNNLQFTPLASSQPWIDDNPDLAEAARDTYIDAQQMVIDNPKDVISEYRDVAGFENEEQISLAAEMMPNTYSTEWGDNQIESISTQLERSQELGIIPNDAPTDIALTL